MRMRSYPIIARAVEEGIAFGLNRAYKHAEAPGREEIADSLQIEIMNALCDVVDFDDEEDEE